MESKEKKGKIDEYEEAPGINFYPDHVLHQAMVALLFLAMLLILAAFFPRHLGITAEEALVVSGEVEEEPLPAWYFQFLFVLLRFMPSEFPEIGTFLMIGVFFALALIPFIDRGDPDKNHPKDRPVGMIIFIISIALLIYLSFGAPFLHEFSIPALP